MIRFNTQMRNTARLEKTEHLATAEYSLPLRVHHSTSSASETPTNTKPNRIWVSSDTPPLGEGAVGVPEGGDVTLATGPDVGFPAPRVKIGTILPENCSVVDVTIATPSGTCATFTQAASPSALKVQVSTSGAPRKVPVSWKPDAFSTNVTGKGSNDQRKLRPCSKMYTGVADWFACRENDWTGRCKGWVDADVNICSSAVCADTPN
jgi:hypothetical protein